MRLTSSGTASKSLKTPLVGRVTREALRLEDRGRWILVIDEIPAETSELHGYRACLTKGRLNEPEPEIPTVSLIDCEHLRSGDIVSVQPGSGFVRTLFRPDSNHNVIFATERCNSNCLMCSQPPKDVDDVGAMTQRNLEAIELIDVAPKRLVITGGEPTILGDNLFQIIAAVRDKFPATYLHMLTNGRAFAWRSFAARLAELKHPDFMLGIPLYSDDAATHDHVVQARNAFDQTVLGCHNLARYGVRIEIRVVLHALTIPRLKYLAEYIYRNLPFVEHIALMGLENIGFAVTNIGNLWIDPFDYQDELVSAVEFLSIRGMNVSIYNHQLCVLPPSLWKFARKSISDWKNIYLDECTTCAAKHDCGGFFQWARKLHSAHIQPIKPDIAQMPSASSV
jgi:His-Xaa-Ser system radical SAM maturase HxsC